jgi:Co/Zn/Cd efflux system component
VEKEEKAIEILRWRAALFSVSALIGASIYILILSIVEIKKGSSSFSNISFMFGFAGANFLISIVCLYLFMIGRDDSILRRTVSFDGGTGIGVGTVVPSASSVNLNMLSAFVHVGSDMLRTIAIILAAAISLAGHQSSGLCDAWAGIIVSATIFVAVIPLLQEMRTTVFE